MKKRYENIKLRKIYKCRYCDRKLKRYNKSYPFGRNSKPRITRYCNNIECKKYGVKV